MCGTASRVRAWLMVEQPGEWGRDAVVQSALGEDVGRRIKQAAAPHGIRVIMLRRPDGSASTPPHIYLCFSGMNDRWILKLNVTRVADVLDVDVSPVAAGVRPPAGIEH